MRVSAERVALIVEYSIQGTRRQCSQGPGRGRCENPTGFGMGCRLVARYTYM